MQTAGRVQAEVLSGPAHLVPRVGMARGPMLGAVAPKPQRGRCPQASRQPQTAQCALDLGLSSQQPWCRAGLWAQPSSCSQGQGSTALTPESHKIPVPGSSHPAHPTQKALP